MSHKYVVTDVDDDKDYVFYDFSKLDSEKHENRLITDGLKEAKNKYYELLAEQKKHRLVLTKVYPDYKTGELKTDLIESNV